MRSRIVIIAIFVFVASAAAVPLGGAAPVVVLEHDTEMTLQMREAELSEFLRLFDDEGIRPERISGPANSDVGYTLIGDTVQSSAYLFERVLEVDGSLALSQALQRALPGDLIHLAPGVYTGPFELSASGEPAKPIGLIGPRSALLVAESHSPDVAALRISGDHLVVSGLSVEGSGNGIAIEGASDIFVSEVSISEVGGRGIVIEAGATGVTIENAQISGTGRSAALPGDGVYVATSRKPMVDISIVSNLFGPGIDGHGVNVDSTTTRGTISNNTFVQVAQLGASSWVELGSSGVSATDNRGSFVSQSEALPTGWSFVEGAGADGYVGNNQVHVEAGEYVGPQLVASSIAGLPTILLPARAMSYTLAEVISTYPTAGERLNGSQILLQAAVVAGPGSLFDLGEESQMLLLESSERGHAVIGGLRSSRDLRG